MTTELLHAAEFFAFARERHQIYLRRRAGLSAPWTRDPILQRYRFTNVFRELDKTTVWFRKYVREPLRATRGVMLATVLFRWFNTIRTGETLFMQPDLDTGQTPWEQYIEHGDVGVLEHALRLQGPPWITGAYMIKSPTGKDKLAGLLDLVHSFATTRLRTGGVLDLNPADESMLGWVEVTRNLSDYRGTEYQPTLESVWDWLRRHDHQGPFLAYEIVTDLRHTPLLDRAPDIMTWANPGPGALRGAARVVGESSARLRKNGTVEISQLDRHRTMEVMRALLELSRSDQYWPEQALDPSGWYYGPSDVEERWLQGEGDWPVWEMREVEHTLCEWDKYERTRLGQGRPRGTYP